MLLHHDCYIVDIVKPIMLGIHHDCYIVDIVKPIILGISQAQKTIVVILISREHFAVNKSSLLLPFKVPSC